MLAASRVGLRRFPAAVRLLSTKADLVKGLAAEQKAVADAVKALGPTASYASIKALVEGEHASTMAKVKEADLSWTWSMLDSKPTKPPVSVAVVGAGSVVGAAALYRIAAGEMLGTDQPVALQLLGADASVVSDLEACGFPLLSGVKSATAAGAAVSGASYVIALEGDFAALGKAVASGAKGALVAVAGNTNALAPRRRATPQVSLPSRAPLSSLRSSPSRRRPMRTPARWSRSSRGARASPTSRMPPSAASGRSSSPMRRCRRCPSQASVSRPMPSSLT